ncbi:hypothetical protein Egran_04125 [Elaphomyces granulatus]|uniref:Uncharacterized protein n=1 Tax=Elaphomyces granulatus TaxID=519963 RepID=A0A232LVH6_9EURO|nr:hypothetical protein Egran_04125 [Elaphomyces granulatus]
MLRMRFPRGQGGEEMALFDWYLWDGMARIEAFGDTHGAIECQPSLSVCCPRWFVQGVARCAEQMKRPAQLDGLGSVCEIEVAMFFRCVCIKTQSFGLSFRNIVCLRGSIGKNEWLALNVSI